jgi:transcriptional regulator with XRE-family HTH domain
MVISEESVHDSLRGARAATVLSQFELSLRLGVSQRHISYVENGRAKPSRALLDAWLVELGVPIATRNSIALKAGYAPLYGQARLTDPELAHASAALTHLLAANDPLPCYVMDEQWNLLQTNRGGTWLAHELMPSLGKQSASTPINMLDLLCHPDGVTSKVTNIDEVGPQMLAQLRHEATLHPAITSKVNQYELLLNELLGSQARHGLQRPRQVDRAGAARSPLMTPRFMTSVGEMAFFSMFTTFGTPYDITLASIRVEHFFAADAATRSRLNALQLTTTPLHDAQP